MLVRLGSKSRNGWLAIDAFGGGGGEERERRDGFFKMFFSSVTGSGGKRRRRTVPFKTAPFGLSFFFLCVKRRGFGENAPFHLKMAPERAKIQCSPQSSLNHFNCIPANFSPRPHSWPRFSL